MMPTRMIDLHIFKYNRLKRKMEYIKNICRLFTKCNILRESSSPKVDNISWEFHQLNLHQQIRSKVHDG